MANTLTTHADRVAETITGSGTGTLTLNGVAVEGHRTWKEAEADLTAFSYVHFLVEDETGVNWEISRGQFQHGTPPQVTRNTSTSSQVLSSSNAGLPVDFPLGTLKVSLVLPAAFIQRKVTFSPSLPTVNDDVDDGFYDGAMWFTSVVDIDQVYYLYDPDPGLADWRPVGPVIGRDKANGAKKCYTVNLAATRWDFLGLSTFNGGVNQNANYCAAFGEAANLQNRHSLAIGGGRSTGQTLDGGHQAEAIVQKGRTTDATPLKLGFTTDPCFEMHENGAAAFIIQVVGYEPATGDSFATEFRCLASRGTGDVTIVAQAETAIGNSAGAAAWDATLGVVAGPAAGDTGPIVTVTGEAAKTIYWTATAWRTSAHKAS